MIIAVVGASRNKEKRGYKVRRFLYDRYKTVYPINPNAKEIDGIKAYPNLTKLVEEIGRVPDLVVFVVPPKVTMKVTEEAVKLGVKKLWYQPGAECEECIEYAKKHGVDVVYNACIIETHESDKSFSLEGLSINRGKR